MLGTMSEQYKTVQTEYGPVRGQLKSTMFDGKPYYSFRGIRYAQPPLTHLRFKVFHSTLNVHILTENLQYFLLIVRVYSHHSHRYHGLKLSMHSNLETSASRNWLWATMKWLAQKIVCSLTCTHRSQLPNGAHYRSCYSFMEVVTCKVPVPDSVQTFCWTAMT